MLEIAAPIFNGAIFAAIRRALIATPFRTPGCYPQSFSET